MVVVLPTPFTPTTNTTQGAAENGAHGRRAGPGSCGSPRAAARAWPARPPVQISRARARAAPPSPACVAAQAEVGGDAAPPRPRRGPPAASGRRPRTRSSTSAFEDVAASAPAPACSRSRNAASAHRHSSSFMRCLRGAGAVDAARQRRRRRPARPRGSSRPCSGRTITVAAVVAAEHVAGAPPGRVAARPGAAPWPARCPGRRRSGGADRRAAPASSTTSPVGVEQQRGPCARVHGAPTRLLAGIVW